jgi:transposase
MSGIMFVMRTGCQWNAIPSVYGSGKTVHRYFQTWTKAGVFKKMWQAGLAEYDDVIGILWTWQAADGAMTKAPLGGQKTGPNPTDRGKSGAKRSLLVDGHGIPLALAVSGANTPDAKLLEPTLATKQIEPTNPDAPQNLCLDKGYCGEPCQQVGQAYGYELHVPDKANAKEKRKRKPGRRKARRWVVEVAHSWINRFRRLLIRWEKKVANYLALLYFACAIVCWRKCKV